jgi:hypothetical protein
LLVVKLLKRLRRGAVEPRWSARPSASVVAVTSPLSIDDPSPSSGIIAGYESSFGDIIFPFTYARVTIPSGDAESGSPVLDLEGRLVGISVASLPQYSSSYLIPARALARLIDDFSTSGNITYSTLPIECDEHADTASLSRQVMVNKVPPDSSASQAGMRVGDTIRRIDGVTIRRLHDYRDALFFARSASIFNLRSSATDASSRSCCRSRRACRSRRRSRLHLHSSLLLPLRQRPRPAPWRRRDRFGRQPGRLRLTVPCAHTRRPSKSIPPDAACSTFRAGSPPP